MCLGPWSGVMAEGNATLLYYNLLYSLYLTTLHCSLFYPSPSSSTPLHCTVMLYLLEAFISPNGYDNSVRCILYQSIMYH